MVVWHAQPLHEKTGGSGDSNASVLYRFKRTYKMCSCYGTAISRLLFFLTARNVISVAIAVHYWHHLSCHGFSSSQRSLTRILVCESKITTILIAFQYYQIGALESPDSPVFLRRGCACQTRGVGWDRAIKGVTPH